MGLFTSSLPRALSSPFLFAASPRVGAVPYSRPPRSLGPHPAPLPGGAGVDRWIVVEQRGPGVHIEVVDDGAGFDPAGIPAERLGVRRSIIERVEAVDGTAEVVSSPGGGTTVRLAWAPGTGESA